ncbi:High mobility group, superfamily [Cordyceps militaris CM01]|uniref:High mobility group, superfamily n=1 Tax=Cordyceps militaris (strain CM01) TaxID=983644 RepID=G3JLP1_CORMM|nr:High mobility group, superfamily [Cordyceps militaris CM01]EGX90615.1 High mobility group, superfamily [Cordyceps militaris CM01]
MLSVLNRAAAGRALSAAAFPTTSRIVVPIFTAPRVRRRLAPIARSFTASARVRFPATAASDKPKKAKTTTTAAKKPAAKKKKAAAAPKKKKPAAKKKPVVKKKKVLTPEQKEKKQLSQLRVMALPKAPKGKPSNLWTVFLADNVTRGTGVSLTDKVKDVAVEFKNLSEHEKARLTERAHENAATNKQALKQWIETYPAEAIYMANLARRRLARKLDKKRPALLQDDRLPKAAPSAYSLFIKSRHDQVSAASPTDAFRQLAQQWKALPEAERQQFKAAASADLEKMRQSTEDLRAKGKAYWAANGL